MNRNKILCIALYAFVVIGNTYAQIDDVSIDSSMEIESSEQQEDQQTVIETASFDDLYEDLYNDPDFEDNPEIINSSIYNSDEEIFYDSSIFDDQVDDHYISDILSEPVELEPSEPKETRISEEIFYDKSYFDDIAELEKFKQENNVDEVIEKQSFVELDNPNEFENDYQNETLNVEEISEIPIYKLQHPKHNDGITSEINTQFDLPQTEIVPDQNQKYTQLNEHSQEDGKEVIAGQTCFTLENQCETPEPISEVPKLTTKEKIDRPSYEEPLILTESQEEFSQHIQDPIQIDDLERLQATPIHEQDSIFDDQKILPEDTLEPISEKYDSDLNSEMNTDVQNPSSIINSETEIKSSSESIQPFSDHLNEQELPLADQNSSLNQNSAIEEHEESSSSHLLQFLEIPKENSSELPISSTPASSDSEPTPINSKEEPTSKTEPLPQAETPSLNLQNLSPNLDSTIFHEQHTPNSAQISPDILEETTQQSVNLPEKVLSNSFSNDAKALVSQAAPVPQEEPKKILINFNNVNIVEFIRFISKLSNKNFVFNEEELNFGVTIISEEPTTIENIMAALLQELRIHGMTMFERGNNVIIHKNPAVNAISRVTVDHLAEESTPQDTEIVTQLFRLNTTDPEKIAPLLRPLVSDSAIVEVFKDTSHVIVTDLVSNVRQIAELLKNIDSPANGLVIGQYVVRRGFIDSLLQLAHQIMQPISQNQTLILVPHRSVNSIFIVSTPFLLERTMSILQYLDQHQGMTRIFDPNDLQFLEETGGAHIVTPHRTENQWQIDAGGNWVFRPQQIPGVSGEGEPQGFWEIDEQGNWRFKIGRRPAVPGGAPGLVGPEGQWKLDSQGIWVFQLSPGQSISPERLVRPSRAISDLPVGHIERTQFYIHKLAYRKGDQVEAALGRIALGLGHTGTSNEDLVQTINTVQWIEASNSLVFTGTVESLDKVRELINEIDTPLRQVFIEMLILETTIDESLTYGVNWGTRFGGKNSAGSQAFLSLGSRLPAALDTTEIGQTPSASNLALLPGFSQGVIGRTLTHHGTEFASIGALIRAVHSRSDTDVVMSPKILTEDNYVAEIFVGLNRPFPSQAIANDRGEIITQNFEYRDVGTRLQVTPQIGENNTITLTIVEEVSSIVAATELNPINQGGPTIRKSNTTTKVHIPNEYFLVISGMMQDEDVRDRDQVPCLGGLPFIGAAFSDKRLRNSKRNQMIFIRPRIIDSESEIDNLTKHEQDIFRYGKRLKSSWKYETDEALDFFNLPGCDPCCGDDCECAP